MLTSELLIITLAMSVGALIKGATGSGLPQLAIPAMAAFIGVEPAVVIMVVPSITTNTWLLITHRRHRTEVLHLHVLLVTGIAGVAVGTLILKVLDDDVLGLIVAGMMLVYVLLFVSRPDFRLPKAATRVLSPIVGLAAGVLQGATGLSGPVLITYLHSLRMDKGAYIFSLTFLFQIYAVIHAVSIAILGLFTTERLVYGLISLIPILTMLRFGAAVSKKLTARTFEYVVVTVMAVSAVRLGYEGIVG